MIAKPFLSYADQVQLLQSRGMGVGDPLRAADLLRQVNYYRLSGYWYPFRAAGLQGRGDDFHAGTTLAEVWALHEFDSELRAAAFAGLSRFEVLLRARLAHELGRVAPRAHLIPEKLGPTARARGRSGEASVEYERWRAKYDRAIRDSRDDYVEHHRRCHGGVLPIWAAIEVLDWGSLSWLYTLAPLEVQRTVAADFALSGPQLSSWLKSLNIVRNVCAHQGRLFNKVFAIKPKMPPAGAVPALDEVRFRVESVGPGAVSDPGYAEHWFGERVFGQLTLVQHLLDTGGLPGRDLLPHALRQFPAGGLMNPAATGAPGGWEDLQLWAR